MLLLLSIVVSYWSTAAGLAGKWKFDSESYAHGFLVAAVSLLIIIRSSRTLFRGDDGYRWVAAIGLLGAGAVWLLAYLSNVLVVQAILLPAMFFLAFWCAFGIRSAGVFLFPLAYFYFAIPVWGYLTGILKAMTIDVTNTALSILGVPALVDGSLVLLPSGIFEIANGCAGLHFLIVSLAISTLYAHENLRTPTCRGVFVATAVFLCLLMNWIRVTTIIYVGHISDMQHYLVTVDHYTFGWVLYVVMLLPLFLIGHMLAEMECRRDKGGEPEVSAGSVPFSTGRMAGRITVAIALLAVFPLLAAGLDRKADILELGQIEMPPLGGEWLGRELRNPDWEVEFHGAAQEFFGEYSDGETRVELYMNGYLRQKQGAELVGRSNTFYYERAWQERSRGAAAVELADGTALPVMRLQLRDWYGNYRYIYYWYLVGDRAFARPVTAKYQELWQRLFGRPASGVVALKVECRQNCESSREALHQFVQDHAAGINAGLSRRFERSSDVGNQGGS
jgi:EpsI family protein